MSVNAQSFAATSSTLSAFPSQQLPLNTVSSDPPDVQKTAVSSQHGLIKTTSGNTADKELAASYATALVDAAQNQNPADLSKPTIPVPVSSKFGQWRQHLDNLLAGPDFKQWADQHNIDLTKPIRITPPTDTSAGHITVTVKSVNVHYPEDYLRTFSAVIGQQLPDSWRLIMQAARVMAPNQPVVEVQPADRSSPSAHAERPATLSEIMAFHGEHVPVSKDKAVERANQLKQTDMFPMPDTSLSTEQLKKGSEEVLEQQQNTLGDIHNKYQLLQQLSKAIDFATPPPEPVNTLPHFKSSLPTPEDAERNEKARIREFFKNNHLQIDPASRYFQDEQLVPGNKVSVEQFLANIGSNIPETIDEINTLIATLRQEVLPSTPLGNLAGALGWQVPVTLDEKKLAHSHVTYNNLGLPGLGTDTKKGDVLDYLTDGDNRSFPEFSDPADLLNAIVTSPKAKELEAALQKKMGTAEDKNSSDWVLATMYLGLAQPSWLDPNKRNEVAGFDLADKAFYGKPLEQIHTKLFVHLKTTKRATQKYAAVASHLLLSQAAPELLVKNIPSSVTYGSPTWFSLKTTVAFIEAKSPGSSAKMTFDQVVKYGSLEPTNAEDEALMNKVKQEALIDWALMYGVLTPSTTGHYSAAQLNAAQDTFSEVMTGLTTISTDLSAPLPTLKDKALEIMGRQIKNVDLEANVITSDADRTSNSLESSVLDVKHGPYSMLDLSLSEHLPDLKDNKKWYSTDQQKVPTSAISALGLIPQNIKESHAAELADFDRNRKKSLTNLNAHLIAQLPLSDRQQLEYGSLEILRKRPIQEFKPNGIASVTATSYPAPDKSNIEEPLYIKATFNKKTITYKFDPANNFIGRSPVTEGLQEEWQEKHKKSPVGYTRTNVIVEPLVDSQVKDSDLRGTAADDASIPASYTSPRTRFLSELVTRYSYQDADLKALTEAAHHTTRFDDEDDEHKRNTDLLFSPLPFVNGIRRLAEGNWKEATVELVFDGVMFLAGGGLLKRLRGLPSLPAQLRRARSFGSPFFKRIRNITSYTPSPQVKNWLSNKTGKYELSKFASRPDIAQGTYKHGTATLSTPAQLDAETGKWYAFDPVNDKRIGKPLNDFKPETARYFDNTLNKADDVADATSGVVRRRKKPNHLEQGLARDNAINIGGDIKDFTILGDDIFMYIDKYKGVERLNVVAHGARPTYRQLLADEPVPMIFNGRENSPSELLDFLKSKGVKPEQFNNVRLLMCGSANGSADSFGSQFGQLIKRNVKAFQGPVRVKVTPEKVLASKKELFVTNPEFSSAEINETIHRRLQLSFAASPEKINPHAVIEGSRTVKEIPFYYRPVKFPAA
ncbi:hypothetical protein QF043_002347 [Pseudomonas sp. W3I7]|uniref:hypothetical protein n=1 Tax=Pseudomonas sp. W3I7 TaxID=3042292 RepID=UPI00279436F0|nr:hypothetical protein [Pseudomonas sp. W3I7]MDQ0703555.1 hypothetical protein [Pseudomonas sp. W3I7]